MSGVSISKLHLRLCCNSVMLGRPQVLASDGNRSRKNKAILRDRHPIELNARRLANEISISLAWTEQRARLGLS
jgi:hypothetical protein